MTAFRKPYAQRPFWQRWSHSLMTWLWFGPLTRDLRPRSQPTRLRTFLALLADLFWYARTSLLPGALPTRCFERYRQRRRPRACSPGTGTVAGATSGAAGRTSESEAHR